MRESDQDGQFLAKIDLTGDPHLVLGRRGAGRKGMEAVRVELRDSLHSPFRAICEQALEKVQVTDGRPYEPTAELESGEEHFYLDVDQIPVIEGRPGRSALARVSREVSGADDVDNSVLTPALISALRDIGRLEYASRNEILEYNPLFYAISWQQSNLEWTHFIRKSSPTRVLKPGRIWMQYSDALVRMEEPVMAIDEDVDIILGAGMMMAFKATPVKDLFSDIHLMMREVPAHVGKVQELLSARIPLSSEAADAIERVARKKYSVAVRLYALPDRIPTLNLTVPRVRQALNKHDLDQGALLNRNKEFDFLDDAVPIFLDVIESRYFEDDWTGELRRADRFSRRPASGERR